MGSLEAGNRVGEETSAGLGEMLPVNPDVIVRPLSACCCGGTCCCICSCCGIPGLAPPLVAAMGENMLLLWCLGDVARIGGEEGDTPVPVVSSQGTARRLPKCAGLAGDVPMMLPHMVLAPNAFCSCKGWTPNMGGTARQAVGEACTGEAVACTGEATNDCLGNDSTGEQRM